MIAAGRRSPAFLPATMAAANMVSDRGASDRPASRALYSSVIWRNSGSAIMAPPSVICCSICPEMPAVKLRVPEQVRDRAASPCRSRLRRTSHRARSTSATAPTAISSPTNSPPSCQTRIPSTTPPMPRTDRTAPTTSIWRGAGVGDVVHQPDLAQHDGDDDDLQPEPDPPRQVGGDEPAQQRPDRGGDRRRRADQRVGLLLGRAGEVAVDQRLHGGQQQRGAEPADDRPEDDDRREVLRERHGHAPMA